MNLRNQFKTLQQQKKEESARQRAEEKLWDELEERAFEISGITADIRFIMNAVTEHMRAYEKILGHYRVDALSHKYCGDPETACPNCKEYDRAKAAYARAYLGKYPSQEEA